MRWLALALLFSCESESTPPTCLSKTPVGEIAEMSFEGDPSPFKPAEVQDPCATSPSLLVLRIDAGWCGTCRWQAAHTDQAIDPSVMLVDVLVANDDNAPAHAADLAAFRRFIVRTGPRIVVADPQFQLRALLPQHFSLPAVLVADRRDLRIVATVTDPDPSVVATAIAAALGKASPQPSEKIDGRFAPWEIDMAKDMLVPGAPLPDPSNAHADDPAAALFGAKLFEETGFSKNGQVACSTCHQAKHSYSDAQPTSTGIGPVDRNAPSITLAAHARWDFWDGRADSSWSQALGPIEAPNEMGSSRYRVAHFIADNYAAEYTAIFGALPPLSDTARFPLDRKPANPNDAFDVDVVFANVGKAIAAHERTFRAQANAFDRWIAGDAGALSDSQKNGLHAFFASGCAQCHWGPRFTDDAFHVLRFPTGRIDGSPDRGRIDGVPLLDMNPFNRAGPFSDAVASVAIAGMPSMIGALKTPTLRGVPSTAPYGHGGTFATLDDVLAVLAKGGDPQDARSIGALEPFLPTFDAKTASSIVTFLSVLTADPQN